VLVRELGAASEVRGDGLDGWQALYRFGVIDRKSRIASLGTSLVRAIACLESADRTAIHVERRRARRLEVAGEAFVDPAYDRRHCHDDEHADGDTHDRERSANLIRPNRVDGHANAFERVEDAVRDPHCYSFLRASIGSSDAALRAG